MINVIFYEHNQDWFAIHRILLRVLRAQLHFTAFLTHVEHAYTNLLNEVECID